MPCISSSYTPTAKERKASQDAVAAREKEINDITNYLCQLCTVLDDPELDVIEGIPGLRDWWAKHQEFDRRRNMKRTDIQDKDNDVHKHSPEAGEG